VGDIEKVTTVILCMIDKGLLNGVYMCELNESINRTYLDKRDKNNFRKGK